MRHNDQIEMFPETEHDPRPSPGEIRDQLERILAGPEFMTRRKPGEVLRFIVENSLAGRTLTEEEIRAEIYPDPPYDPEATNARTAVNTIRHLLAGFYTGSGRYHPVLIELPKKFSKSVARKTADGSYRVECRYNRISGVLIHFMMGKHCSSKGTPEATRKALQFFDLALAEYPEHFDAKFAKLECLCLTMLYLPSGQSRMLLIKEAVELALNLSEVKPEDCRVHLLMSITSSFCRCWPAMAEALFRASRLDPETTGKSLWFPTACLLAGFLEQATKIARNIAMERVADCAAWSFLGFCLYLNRQFNEAEEKFSVAAALDRHSWMPGIGRVLVCLSTERPGEALEHWAKTNQLVGEVDGFLPGLALLAEFRLGHELDALPNQLLADGANLLSAPDMERDFLQLAIATVDVGGLDPLIKAIRFCQPLVQLLPFWPIFDPLRMHPEFEALMEQIAAFPDRQELASDAP